MNPQERVAVIAVHGVADQAPNVSARQMANLLGRLEADAAPPYRAFQEETIRLPVGRLTAGDSAHSCPTYLRISAESSQPDIDFTYSQLAGFVPEGPEATYQTVRISCSRSVPDGTPLPVDVYEMYWADLSRVGTTALRIFGELYQVLLHLGSLGKQAASAAVGRQSGVAGHAYRFGSAGASWLLAAPIAVLNLYFAVPAAIVLVSFIPEPRHGAAASLALAIILLVTSGLLVMRTPRAGVPSRVVAWMATLLMAVLASRWSMSNGLVASRLLATLAVSAALAGCAVLISHYRRHRPSAGWTAFVASVFVLGAAVPAIGRITDSYSIEQAGISLLEPMFVALRLAWVSFFLAAWIGLLGGIAFWLRQTKELGRRARVGRAVETTAIALTIPALGFIATTIALWASLVTMFGSRLTGAYVPIATGYLFACASPGACRTDADLVRQVLANSVTVTAIPAGLLVILAGVLAAWALGPVVWYEVRPARMNAGAKRMGAWVDALFPLLRVAGIVFVIAVAVVWPVPWSALLSRLPFGDVLVNPNTVDRIIAAIGVAIALPAAGLFAFRGRLDVLAAGFRAPIDLLLDVDGYLREHPRDATPRARIFARYVSLLRHIEQGDYTRLVIVAHSQGTAITADLLRYLKQRGPHLSLPPTTLFTMGSPLRQLYAWRFPDLYQWAWTTDSALCPDPRALHGVERWLNAYRSGDYVGRALWRPRVDRFIPPCDPVSWKSGIRPHHYFVDGDAVRCEFCVGAGAHTHYWDATAPGIAVELDHLVMGARFPEQGVGENAIARKLS
jgi:hypothetical protein